MCWNRATWMRGARAASNNLKGVVNTGLGMVSPAMTVFRRWALDREPPSGG